MSNNWKHKRTPDLKKELSKRILRKNTICTTAFTKEQHTTLPKTTAQLIFGRKMISQTLILRLTENITNKRKQSLINNQRESY